MSQRPEIVLPPGLALRIDYDPASSPASLLVTALRDDTPIGQAHVNPREVGSRLRLELAEGVSSERAEASQLRLTPERAMRVINMEAVPVPRVSLVPIGHTVTLPTPVAPPAPEAITPRSSAAAEHAMAALHELAREGVLDGHAELREDIGPQRPLNALVWLEHGRVVVLPSQEAPTEEDRWSRVQRALRSVSEAAAELLVNPFRLRGADEGWASWRASWRGVQPASAATE